MTHERWSNPCDCCHFRDPPISIALMNHDVFIESAESSFQQCKVNVNAFRLGPSSLIDHAPPTGLFPCPASLKATQEANNPVLLQPSTINETRTAHLPIFKKPGVQKSTEQQAGWSWTKIRRHANKKMEVGTVSISDKSEKHTPVPNVFTFAFYTRHVHTRESRTWLKLVYIYTYTYITMSNMSACRHLHDDNNECSYDPIARRALLHSKSHRHPHPAITSRITKHPHPLSSDPLLPPVDSSVRVEPSALWVPGNH